MIPVSAGSPSVECVSNSLEIQNKLQQYSDGDDPEYLRSILNCQRRPRKPFASADRGGEQNGSGTDRLKHIDWRKRRRLWKRVLAPLGKTLHMRRW